MTSEVGKLMPSPTESETNFLSWIMDLARLRGWMIHHCRPAQNQRGKWATAILGDAGFPDLVLARQGRVILAEVKGERAKLTMAQEQWFASVAYFLTPAVSCYVWRPSDRPKIQEILA